MKKSRFTDQHAALAQQQAEGGAGRGGVPEKGDRSSDLLPTEEGLWRADVEREVEQLATRFPAFELGNRNFLKLIRAPKDRRRICDLMRAAGLPEQRLWVIGARAELYGSTAGKRVSPDLPGADGHWLASRGLVENRGKNTMIAAIDYWRCKT